MRHGFGIAAAVLLAGACAPAGEAPEVRREAPAVAGASPETRAAPEPVLAGALTPAERVRNAKVLFFDGRYGEARQLWQQAAGDDDDGADAAYWIARCSEGLEEHARAIEEYDRYLVGKPRNPALVEEARTRRVGVAARLYRAGQTNHLTILQQGLSDPSRTVRYFSALQLADLGADVGAAAVPVLRTILNEERDADLVDRAKLALLRLDPGALTPEAGAKDRDTNSRARWVRLRVYNTAGERPEVSINVPLALADIMFKSLPEDARRELRREGYDAEGFLDRLRKLGPTEILKIENRDGSKVEIWID